MSVVVVYAHPYPRRSRAGKALLDAIEGAPGVAVRSLYDLYPDFTIDVESEQKALAEAAAIVWQSPFYWYGVPSLLHHWFEKVLTEGWAYGPGGRALSGKPLQWATTTGTSPNDYRPDGMHAHAFADFVHPIEQTARFCGMTWQPPFVVEDAHDLSDAGLAERARAYRATIDALSGKS